MFAAAVSSLHDAHEAERRASVASSVGSGRLSGGTAPPTAPGMRRDGSVGDRQSGSVILGGAAAAPASAEMDLEAISRGAAARARAGGARRAAAFAAADAARDGSSVR